MSWQSLFATKSLSVCKVAREKAIASYYTLLKFFGNKNDIVVDTNGLSLQNFKSGVVLQQFFAKASAIDGMTAHDELATLFYTALLAPKGDIIEIGSWLGKSTVFLAQACKTKGSGKVFAIDTFNGNPGKEDWYTAPLDENESILSRFKKNLQLVDVEKWVEVCPYSSAEAKKKLKNKQASVIFIDGCHEYKGIISDISLWKNQVSKGGFILFHDFHPNFPGVISAIMESFAKDKSFKALCLFDTLLLLQKQ